MPEAKSKFLKDIMDRKAPEPDEPASFSSERQHTAQAFTLHVEWRDGRRSEGFAWAHYAGYQWQDNGDVERLLLVFGPRALEIEGHNLGALVTEVRDGQLNRVREMPSSQQLLLRNNNPESMPVISAIRSFPDIDDILKELKGEGDDKGRHAGRLQR